MGRVYVSEAEIARIKSNYCLEDVVMVNKMLDYLLEKDYRCTKEYIQEVRAEGEIIETIIFEQMMPTPR